VQSQEPVARATTLALSDVAAQPGAPTPTHGPWLPSLQTVWLSGVVAGFVLLLAGFGRLAWVASRSRPIVDGEWTETLDALSPARHVRLLQSGHPTLLVTWGWRRPTVLLPLAARAWSGDRIRVVLCHELAHVERHDWAFQMVAELLRCLYWFNPLVWLACRRLRQESEQACDDAVLGMGVEAPEYAEHLLDVARAFRHTRLRRSLFPAPAMARRSHLERRVRAMLNKSVDRRPLARWAGIAIGAALLGISGSIAGLVAASDVPQPTPRQAVVRMHGGAELVVPVNVPATARRANDSSQPPAIAREAAPKPTASPANGPATMTGTLVDATGRFMPDIPMALIDGAAKRYETRSDSSGRFLFTDLPAGEYQVEVKKPGFLSKQGRVVLAAAQQVERDIVAQIGSLEEVVIVAAGRGVGAVTPPRPPLPVPPDPCAGSPVGGCLTPPLKLVDAPPPYPRAHAENGVSGKVAIEGRIGTDGFLKDLRANDGADPAFAASGIDAVSRWEFSPVRLNGVAQECRIVVIVQFSAARD